MATSRFSQVFSPSEYTQPFDLGIYAQLVNQRQNTYDRNIQVVENELGQYTKLPIMHSGVKAYTNQKVRETTDKMNSIYQSADYSDPNVMRQIRSQVSSIANDPVISNGLISTANLQADQKAIEDSKKNKTYTYQNEYQVKKRMNAYLSNPDINGSYSAGGYTPFEDHDKPIVDALTKLKDNGSIEMMMPDPNDPSKQVLTRIKRSEINGDRIEKIVNGLWTPGQRTQMAIDADFIYRGYTERPDDPQSVGWITSTHQQYLGKQLEEIQNAKAEIARNRQTQINFNPNADIVQFDDAEKGLISREKSIQAMMSNPQALYEEGVKGLSELKTWAYTRSRIDTYRNLFEHSDIDATQSQFNPDSNGSNSNDGSTGNKKLVEGPAGVIGSTGLTNSPVTNEIYANHSEEVVRADINKATIQLQESANASYETLSIKDPIRFPSEKKNEILSQWDKLWSQGTDEARDALPAEALEHYTRTSEARILLDQTMKVKSAVDQQIQSDPEYVKAVEGVNGLNKTLKSEYIVPIEFGIGDRKGAYDKAFKKEAIQELITALIKTNQSIKPLIDQNGVEYIPGKRQLYGIGAIIDGLAGNQYLKLETELPRGSGDNSLIDELNKHRSDALKLKMEFNQKHPIIGSASSLIHLGNDYTVTNPLFLLSEKHPELAKNLQAYQQYGNIVKSKTEKAYSDKGFVSMVPGVALSNEAAVQNFYINQIKSVLPEDAGTIKSVTSFKRLPDDQIEVQVTLDKGSEKGMEYTFAVPETRLLDISKQMPADKDRNLQQYIRVTGGTSPVISDAPVIAFKKTFPNGSQRSVVVPYRIVDTRKDGSIAVQFFRKDGSLNTEIDNNKTFQSLSDLNRNLPKLAEYYWMSQNGLMQNQPQTIKIQ